MKSQKNQDVNCDSSKYAQKRRKLMKVLAAGSGAAVIANGIPDKWGRPIINSTLLPAHASTSFTVTCEVLYNGVTYNASTDIAGTTGGGPYNFAGSATITLSPPHTGVPVTLAANNGGGLDDNLFFDPGPFPTNGAGVATIPFNHNEQSGTTNDLGCGLNFNLSTPGVSGCSINLGFDNAGFGCS